MKIKIGIEDWNLLVSNACSFLQGNLPPLNTSSRDGLNAREILDLLDSQFEENDSIGYFDESCIMFLELMRKRYGFDVYLFQSIDQRRFLLGKENRAFVDPLASIYEAFASERNLSEEAFFEENLVDMLIRICDTFCGVGECPDLDSPLETLFFEPEHENLRNTIGFVELLSSEIKAFDIDLIELRRGDELSSAILKKLKLSLLGEV